MRGYKEIEIDDNPYNNKYFCPYGHEINYYDFANKECSVCESEHEDFCEETKGIDFSYLEEDKDE